MTKYSFSVYCPWCKSKKVTSQSSKYDVAGSHNTIPWYKRVWKCLMCKKVFEGKLCK